MVKVLFVCLGNICRSPMAEGIFKALTKDNQSLFECDSAGTSSYHIGEKADERMRDTAKAHHISIEDHRARQLSREDFDNFDYIIAMDKSNYQNILMLKNRINHTSETNIMLMRSFDTEKEDLEVPDPYYGSVFDFENVYEILFRCNERFISFLKDEHHLNI